MPSFSFWNVVCAIAYAEREIRFFTVTLFLLFNHYMYLVFVSIDEIICKPITVYGAF